MGAEGSGMLSLRALNTITVTLALGLVALAGWHFQNPGHFELIQVPRSTSSLCCNEAPSVALAKGPESRRASA